MAAFAERITIDGLLEKMTASDADFRFMAVNDMINELQNGTLRISGHESAIVKTVLSLLEDSSGEVQSLTVTALSVLTKSVKNEQISYIISQLVGSMANSTVAQVRSINGIGLKSVVSAISLADPSLVAAVIEEPIIPLINIINGHPDMTVRIEACEILSDILFSFGSSLTANHNDLLDCFLLNLSISNSPLRKRLVQAIGALVWSVSDECYSILLGFILFRFGIAVGSSERTGTGSESFLKNKYILERSSLLGILKQPVGIEELKTLLQCLGVISRNPQRLANEIPVLLLKLMDLLKNPSSVATCINNSRSDIKEEDFDEIRELGIQLFDSLIRRSSWLLMPIIDELVSLLLVLLQHDPNYNYGNSNHDAGDNDMDADEEEEDYGDDQADDDEDAYSDDEDASWKVRRAAAKAIEACISSYPELLAMFYRTVAPVLIKRFVERIESVRLEVFSCFSALLSKTRTSTFSGLVGRTKIEFNNIQSTSWSLKTAEFASRLADPSSPQSLLLEQLPIICNAICRQISARDVKGPRHPSSHYLGKTSLACKQAAFLLLRDLAVALPGRLTPYLAEIINLIIADFRDPSITNTAKIEVIALLNLLLKMHGYINFAEHKEILNKITVMAITDPFYRVAVDGMDLVQELTVRPKGCRDDLLLLFPVLVAQLKVNTSDLELKEKVIATVAVFLECLGDILSKDQLQECLDLILSRLKNEITRTATIKAIIKICSTSMNTDISSFLKETITELAACLAKKDRTLRIISLRCLTVICQNFEKHLLSSQFLPKILEIIPQLVSISDLQVSQATIQLVAGLLEHSTTVEPNSIDGVACLVTSDAFMEAVVNLVHSNMLHGQILDSVLLLMRCIGQFHRIHPKCRLTIPFILERLMVPISSASSKSTAHFDLKEPTAHSRDSLPNLARCLAELLAQLPLTSNSPPSINKPDSVQTAVNQLVSVVKNPEAPVITRYLNLLSLGELGRRVNLSDHRDLLDLLLTYVSTPFETANAELAAGIESSGSCGLHLSSEIRPAAAVSLGRLVVGQPAKLLPFLVDTVNKAESQLRTSSGSLNEKELREKNVNFYYLLRALREAVVNLLDSNGTDVIRENLDTLWLLLLSNSGRAEEGARNLVAECLGRIALISPATLVARLQSQLNLPETADSPLTRCTLVSAAKYLLMLGRDTASSSDISATPFVTDLQSPGSVRVDTQGAFFSSSPTSYSVVNDELETALCVGNPPALSEFLNCLIDVDISVRKAALITMNTAAHHRPGLIRPLLNQPLIRRSTSANGEWPLLLDLLYGETAVKPELIRVVDMGPFKYQEDDGLELRKIAYECLSTLLDTCLDCLNMSSFLDHLIAGMTDHNDIKILVYQVLQRIIQLCPCEVSQKMPQIAAPLKAVLLARSKNDLVKQEVDKLEELKRCAIVVIVDLKNLPDCERNTHFLDLLRALESDPSLKSTYDQVVSSLERTPHSRKTSFAPKSTFGTVLS